MIRHGKYIAILTALAMIFIAAPSYSQDKTEKQSSGVSARLLTAGETKADIKISASGVYTVVLRKSTEKPVASVADDKAPAFKKSIEVGKLKNSGKALFKSDLKKGETFELKDLDEDTKYALDFYSASKDSKKSNSEAEYTFEFWTLAKEPTVQAGYVGFAGATENSISFNFVHGDGKSRVVLVRKDKLPALPTDGVPLTGDAKFGSEKSKVADDTYCVYSGSDRGKKPMTVTDLQPGKYWFQVFEFNGQEGSVNYFTDTYKSNPRGKTTALKAPKALDPFNVAASGFGITWTASEGAATYIVELSADEQFKSLVAPYEGVDVGLGLSFEFDDLKPGEYFFRVRAVAEESQSAFSNVVKVVLK